MKQHGKRLRGTPAQAPGKLAPDPAVRNSSEPYKVDMTASAEAVYVALCKKAKEAEKRGDYSSSHCTVFNMVRSALRESIPSDPLNRLYALTGDLSNIFRIKKGRYRICWIASSKLRRICILYISETLRKEGDVNDPYRIFAQAVMSGQFNDIFAKYGVRMPNLKSSPDSVRSQ